MFFGMRFPLLRLVLLLLAALAQSYLFVYIWRSIRSSNRSVEWKTRATWLAGVSIVVLFALNAIIVSRPIPWVDPPVLAQIGILYPVAIWNLGSMLSAPLLIVAQILVGLGSIARRIWQSLKPTAHSNTVNLNRRRFLKVGMGSLAAVPMVISGYGAAYASKAFEIEEVSLPFGCSLRVVQLTDIHAGLYMTRDEIRRYVNVIRNLRPDLFVLTGDFISNSMSFLPGCVEEMARVRARYGTFVTLGNHENRFGTPSAVQAMFEHHGIVLLQNAHRIIQTEDKTFAVAGIDDLQTGNPDLEAAIRGLDPSVPTMLLSHRPEIFPQAASQGVRLTLSGHWHGGQIKLRVLGRDVSPIHHRTPYPEGLYTIDASHLYVSRGIGTTGTPVRLNAPPEVTLFHLT